LSRPPKGGIVRIIPDAHPSLRSGPTCGRPNSFHTNLSNPRSGAWPLVHFPGVLLRPLGHLSTYCLIRPGAGLFASSLASLGPTCGRPNSFHTNLSNPRSGAWPLVHFPGVLLRPLGHLSEKVNAAGYRRCRFRAII
jgi:hypothetical protein